MEELLLGRAARDLSQEEAFELLIFLAEQGEIELVDPVKTDNEGNVISLRPGQQVKVRTSMAGVDFYRAPPLNPGVNGSAGATKIESFEPTPAFAIVLYRLAKMLAEKWQATKIVWGGIGHGSGKNEKDCHMTGHCVDFYGATAGAIDFDVRRDWWRKTVRQKDGDGTPHATLPNVDDRWGNDTHTYFRLAFSKDHRDVSAYEFFADVYQFVTEQCTLGSGIEPENEAAAFRGGSPLKAGTVMHPDYPVPGVPKLIPGRRTHNDHIHFQLGNAYE